MEDLEITDEELDKIKNNLIITKNVNGKDKKYLKGGRLSKYPSGINICCHSREIKVPPKEKMTYEKAKEITKDFKLIYSKSNAIVDKDTNIILGMYKREMYEDTG